MPFRMHSARARRLGLVPIRPISAGQAMVRRWHVACMRPLHANLNSVLAERATMTASGHAIPTIDFSDFLTGEPTACRAVADAIGAASEQYGFMRLVGHPVAPRIVADTFTAGTAFFEGPAIIREAVRENRNNRGYNPMFDNVYPGEKPAGQESFSMGHPMPPDDPALRDLPFYAPTPWPAQDGFRAALERCFLAMFGLGEAMLQGMAMHLGRPADFFAGVTRDTYSNMRVIHYPTPEAVADVTDFGSRPHEDRGLITLLIQDGNGGLEVMGPGKQWLPVEPDPAAVIVNVGRLLRRWTNGRYKSAIHRVVNRSGRDRLSIPLFVHPGFHQVIDAADFAAPSERVRFAPIVAGEATYADFARQRPAWQQVAAAG
jgi:isopenicillin N synthase-like dioxygenase